MKKGVLILTIPAILFAGSLFAQRNTLKFSPLSLLIRDVHVQFETAINEVSSFQIGATWFPDFTFTQNGKMTVSGYGLFPEYRYFFTHAKKDVPEGFYGGGYGVYRRYNGKFEFEDGNRTGVGRGGISIYALGGMAGYQVIANRFVFDFTGGLGYYSGKLSDIEVEYSDGTSGFVPLGRVPKPQGFLPRINLAIGFAF